MANKTFEVALLLTAKDQATRVIAAAAARQKQIMAMSQRGDAAFATGRQFGTVGLAATAALFIFTKQAEDAETATLRLNKAFEVIGITDKNRAIQANKTAEAMSLKIGKDYEEIKLAQAKLVSFSEVSKNQEVFNRATQAAYDLEAGGFGVAIENATQLGKALQNPALGAAALSRTGALNKSDVAIIKQIQATRGLGAAQQFVLAAVEKQVKGQAENTANASDKMKVAFKQAGVVIGSVLLPQAQALIMSIIKNIEGFKTFIENNKELIGAILKVVAGAAALTISISILAFAFGGVFKIIALGMSVINGYRTLMITVTAVQNAMAFSALSGASGVGILSAALKAANLAFLTSPIFLIVAAIALSAFLIIRYWKPISTFFISLWAGIKNIFTGVFNFMKNIGNQIMDGLFNGIKSKAMMVFESVKTIGKGIATAFKTVLGIASPSKVFMDYGVNITEGAHNGIKKGQSKLVGASAGMANTIKPAAGRSGGAGGGSSVTVNFSPVISGGSGDVASQVKALIPELIRQIENQMQRKQRLAY